MARVINEAGVALIKGFETCRLAAYTDVRGIWTIGWGHAGGVAPGQIWTQAQADQALLDDLRATEAAIERSVGAAATTDNQFAAMVSLAFNIGAPSFATSTVLREHCAGRFQPAADGFMLWNKATINHALQEVPGLTRRRTAERTLYLS